MKLQEIRRIAQDRGISIVGKMNKEALIHTIQRHEGNPQCFATDPYSCGQEQCLWQQDCIAAVKKKG